jgi:hypothetical protein
MDCGGGHGFSDIFANDPLVEAGVIELKEEMVVPWIESKSKSGEYWGSDEEFNRFVDLQVTAMALNACSEYGTIPITDRIDFSVPVKLAKRININRFANLHAAALAMQSLDIVIPLNSKLNSMDILEARFRLRDQLLPFRMAMLSLSPLVRQGIEAHSSVDEIKEEAKYVVETTIAPTLYDLHEKVVKERDKFWHKLVLESGLLAPRLILNWVTKDTLTAAISSIENAQDVALDLINHRALVSSLKNHGGLGYLLSLGDLLTEQRGKSIDHRKRKFHNI